MTTAFDRPREAAFVRPTPVISGEDREPHNHDGNDRYAVHFSRDVLNSPMFEAKDVAGLIGITAMTLGPLAAYAFGYGA